MIRSEIACIELSTWSVGRTGIELKCRLSMIMIATLYDRLWVDEKGRFREEAASHAAVEGGDGLLGTHR